MPAAMNGPLGVGGMRSHAPGLRRPSRRPAASAGAAAAVTSLFFGLVGVGCSCDGDQGTAQAADQTEATAASGRDLESSALTETEQQARERQARIDREFPLHGLVTGLQLVVREAPDPESTTLGWVRVGSRIRLAPEVEKTENCNTGWYRVYPRGWLCAGQGIDVGEEPPTAEFEVPPPDREQALPYGYWMVKEEMVPEYHRLPSRDEQRAALAYSGRVLELLADGKEHRAEKMLAGEIPSEPRPPAVVNRYLDRGFFLASTGVEVRAFRRFVRTPRGRYVKQAQLLESTPADFRGVDLTEEGWSLPVAWTVRGAQPRMKVERGDGTVRVVLDPEAEAIPRQALLEGWRGRENVGGRIYHVLELEGGERRYLKSWFAAVAEAIDPPQGLQEDEPWVHVDLGEQTLVVYRGSTPVYATLVSSGVDGFDSPVGEFTIKRKYIGDTMANVGDDKDERYSIEDVPWAQYFEGAVALHGAFWHGRFGLRRSHGCINLSPADAHRVFDETWPRVPDGWLGVMTDQTPFRGSRVVVTE